MDRCLTPSGLRSKMALSSSLYSEMRALPGWRLNQVCGYNFPSRIQNPETVQLILISFVNDLAFPGAHMRICDAQDCKTGREGGLYECTGDLHFP